MKVGIRVDASFQIGTGHLMRCLTLADYLSSKKAEVLFLCRNLPDHLQNLLSAKRFPLLKLESGNSETLEEAKAGKTLAHAGWLGVSQSSDAENCKRVLEGEVLDWLVVDHYALDSTWEKALRQNTKSVFVIDDLADREHDCDLLLDQNYYPRMSSRYTLKVPDSCLMLIGPKYALLRDEFRSWRAKVSIRKDGVRRVFVFFGGVDASNFTGLCLGALKASSPRDYAVDVVVGAQHPYMDEIRVLCAEQGYDLHVQSGRMAELMACSDIAIGATGATSWERCCLGLPAITISLADNQIEIAQGLQRMGASIYLGGGAQVDPRRLAEQLAVLVATPEVVRSMSERAFELVDGDGVVRIFEAMAGRYAHINSLHGSNSPCI